MVEPQVSRCDTEAELAAAAPLFDRYRRHYGQPPDHDGRTHGWLTEMVRSQLLTVYTATLTPAGDPGSADATVDDAPVGLATAHVVPASLTMGRTWLLRDLYVEPRARRRGVAVALVEAVREAARGAGAARLSLVTEPDNRAALDLYRSLGFRSVEPLTSLGLDLLPASGDDPAVARPAGRSGAGGTTCPKKEVT